MHQLRVGSLEALRAVPAQNLTWPAAW